MSRLWRSLSCWKYIFLDFERGTFFNKEKFILYKFLVKQWHNIIGSINWLSIINHWKFVSTLVYGFSSEWEFQILLIKVGNFYIHIMDKGSFTINRSCKIIYWLEAQSFQKTDILCFSVLIFDCIDFIHINFFIIKFTTNLIQARGAILEAIIFNFSD